MDLPVPQVSVIVPANNEEQYIQSCIDSIRNTGWPAERLEIIVVDNNSHDRTAALAAASGARVVSKSSGRIGAIRNAGLAQARGEYVAYVDGDCTVASTWLRTSIAAMQADATIGAIGGPCLAPITGTWVERCLASASVRWQGMRIVESLATSSFISRRQLLQDLGGFNEELRSGEDSEISSRIRARGLSLCVHADCSVVHYGYPQSLLSVLKKQLWHGSNQLEASSKLSLMLILSHLALFSILGFAASLIVLPFDPRLGWLCALLACISFLMPVGVYAAKRAVTESASIGRIAQWVPIGTAYFAGRAWGLLMNYRRKIAGTSRLS